MRKALPLTISNFKDIIDGGYYYVDKTLMIKEILDKKVGVLLVTRPRRFGKTLNMSTLKYFFDMDGAKENRELFRGLEIEKTEHMSEQGRYPVVHLTMKELGGETTLQDTKDWYNGYLFGKERVYNPWSIMHHCESGELKAFWIGTSANLLISFQN